jgi:hypothetical protein
VQEIVGGDTSTKVPFTLWKIGPLLGERTLFRLRLDMSAATFASQIGRVNGFTAYGEDILLEKIQSEDIPGYLHSDRSDYEGRLRDFLSMEHLIPETFEYLVVGPEGVDLPWDTTPLSSRILQRSISPARLERCTRWFVAETSDAARWFLSAKASKPYSTFGLRVTRHEEPQGESLVAG